MPSLRLGLALCITRAKHSLKNRKHSRISRFWLSKIILFLWFHKLQHPAMTASLKQIKLFLWLPSIRSSITWRSLFHSRFNFYQKFWLKSHEKKRCSIVSLVQSWHRTHSVESTWKFFLVSRYLVFNLSSKRSQKKNLCLGRTLDFQIHWKGGGAVPESSNWWNTHSNNKMHLHFRKLISIELWCEVCLAQSSVGVGDRPENSFHHWGQSAKKANIGSWSKSEDPKELSGITAAGLWWQWGLSTTFTSHR